ncbi:molybdenum cofactor cytidylyltransferase [Aidingimonas halophila]|uniref:Molybdenum cofactor cytidylyltransferase n=2 Tax=Aidingimonas halophila TaxID=574349 RepID=A0A1H2QE06_9GAMM|nr:molybdenum cofactor cytidylyltransferase [Aidingimonas halophila]
MVAVIMAAGRSQRFGRGDKRLANLPDGRTVLAATLARTAEAVSRVRVVLREDDDPAALGLACDTPIMRARRADNGLGASLADAFAVLMHDPELLDCRVAAVVLADMPFVRPETVQALQRETSASRIVRPRHGERLGHPVCFGRDVWSELSTLDGDRGGRSIIHRHSSRYREVDVDDPGIHADIDTPADIVRS